MLNLYLLLITFQSYNVGESPLSNLTKEEILHRQKIQNQIQGKLLKINFSLTQNMKCVQS